MIECRGMTGAANSSNHVSVRPSNKLPSIPGSESMSRDAVHFFRSSHEVSTVAIVATMRVGIRLSAA